jgi:deoxycytidylate deaminase
MYMTCGVPCKECLKGIINSGISELVCTSLEHYDLLTTVLLRDSDLVIRTYIETEA